jgi:hypothetical protein
VPGEYSTGGPSNGGIAYWQVYAQMQNTTSGAPIISPWGCGGYTQTTSPQNSYVVPPCGKKECPILIDTADEGFHLTDAADGVMFRNDPDSSELRLSWTDPNFHNGWLALPKNGKVESLSELFGNFTPQPPSDDPNGFRALAVYDLNHDGVIDAADPIYSKLRVWIDSNHDGIAQPEELHSLQELGIERISLDYHESRWTDQFGNQFRYVSAIADSDAPRDKRTYDVFLTTKP